MTFPNSYGGPVNTGSGMGQQPRPPIGFPPIGGTGMATPGGGVTGAPLQGTAAPTGVMPMMPNSSAGGLPPPSLPPTPAPSLNPPEAVGSDPRQAVANAMTANPQVMATHFNPTNPPPRMGGFNFGNFGANLQNFRTALQQWRAQRPDQGGDMQAWFGQRPNFRTFFGQPVAQPLTPTGVMPINPNAT